MNNKSIIPSPVVVTYPVKRAAASHPYEYRYPSLATLGSKAGVTCSVDVAVRCGKAGEIRGYATFEEAAQALKQGVVSALLVPAAYPNAYQFIQDADLRCDRVFIMRIPALVLAGKGERPPRFAIALLHHPATKPLLSDVELHYGRAIEVQSNAAAAEMVANEDAGHCLAITNGLCAAHYGLSVYKILRSGVEMPWLVFVPARRTNSQN